MRSIEDKNCVNNGSITQDQISGGSCMSFDFHKSNGGGGGVNRTSHHHRTALGKPTPSKWDDAQKWLVNLSRGDKSHPKASPRNSNADDRRLIAPVPKKDYSSEDDNESSGADQFEMETKNVVDCEEETVWRINKPVNSTTSKNAAVRSICVRDMGTEMTPIASQEPSRTATPIRATTPAVGSPMSSGALSPARRCNNEGSHGQNVVASEPRRENGPIRQDQQSSNNDSVVVNNNNKGSGDIVKKLSPLESRAVAWDEAERAKYTARYKREEVKIQAWENHQKRKAEMEMRKVEVKAERLKARAQEKYTNKLASTRRIAEEKRANAEAKLNEKAVKTSESADYIRRTGHLPSSFSFKLPSFCW